ncbi:MAG: SDR family oxidoreductase [Roseiflexaceae bacterium]|nr:SDR family oxidoreductase [Roseiflexaceae bacterium]
MNILIVGATGVTGRTLAEQALARGHHVTTLTRDPAKLAFSHAQLTVIPGDVLDPACVDAAVASQDAVLILLSQPSLNAPSTVSSAGTQHIVQAMERHGVRRLVSVTMLGIGASRKNASVLYNRLLVPLVLKHVMHDKQRQEDAIQHSALDWTIVRPPRLTDAAARAQFAVIADGPGTVNSMPRGDLAAFMLSQVADQRFVRQAVVVGYA